MVPAGIQGRQQAPTEKRKSLGYSCIPQAMASQSDGVAHSLEDEQALLRQVAEAR
jgi:hypothetical protein